MKKNNFFLIRKLGFVVMTFIMLTIIACEKDSDINTIGNEKVGPAISTDLGTDSNESVNDEPLIICSKVFAQAQNNSVFRDLIASEIGNTESNVVFYVQIKNKSVGTMTVADFFQSIANKMGMALPEDYFSNELSKITPNLSFAAYSNSSGTDMKGFNYNKSFYILPATTSFDTKTKKMGVAYDQNLNEIQISNTDDPNFSVIVVEDNRDYAFVNDNYSQSDIQNLLNKYGIDVCDKSMNKVQSATLPLNNLKQVDPLYGKTLINLNELISLNMSNCNEIDYSNSKVESSDYDKTDGFDYKTTPTIVGTSECSQSCDRNNLTGRERITQIKVVHSELKKFCKWWKSNCKIQVDLAFATLPDDEPVLSSYPSKFIIGDRTDMKNGQTFTTNLDMFTWLYCDDDHGDPYVMNFIGKHHNAGSTTTLSFGLPKVTFSVSELIKIEFATPLSVSKVYTATDNPLGGDAIEYCDTATGVGTKYTTGSMDFFVRRNSN